MPYKSKWPFVLILAVLVLSVSLTACAQATPAQPQAAQPKAPAPTAALAQQATAALPPTATATAPAEAAAAATNTAAPTFTATPLPPTATPQPSATPNLALAQDGLSAWCLPQNVLVSAASDPLAPPAKAQIGKIENGALEIRNMPWSACVFLYTFNQPAPSGLTLEIYDLNQKTPWWKADLTPISSKPTTVYTLLRHTYIIDPPLWNVGYEFAVRDANGTELHRDRVNLHRWVTGLCWQGTYPDVRTLYCPPQQDLHPWDPGYGKKLPTVTPRP